LKPPAPISRIAYKYTRPQHLESFLAQGRFAFPSVAQLNDPFESSVDAVLRDLEKLRSDFKNIPLHARNPVVKVKYFGTGVSDVAINPDFDDHNERIRFHNQDVKKRNEQVDQQNDRIQKGITLLEEFRASVGVLSLTTNPKDVVMWAHYGSNGAGACIGIDLSHPALGTYIPHSEHLKPHKHLFMPIDLGYSKVPPICDGDEPAECVYKAFFTKFERWSYEEELRILRPISECLADRAPLFAFPTSLIREIIIGHAATDDTQTRAINLASRLPNVSVKRARVRRDSYAIELEETSSRGTRTSW